MTYIGDERHLNWFSLHAYLEADAPAAIPIAGDPRLQLIIEPSLDRVAMRVPLPNGGQIPDLSSLRHFDTQSGADSSGNWIEFGANGSGILREAYPVLMAVADYMQVDGYDMGAAIGRALDAYRQLLSVLGRLSDDQELGLLGELIILERLIDSIGAPRAIDAWRGPENEEHDFGLEAFDLEVKSTLTEDRIHQIASLTQLEPSPKRDLWMISVQLTTGGLHSVTLPQMIDRIRNLLSSSPLRARFQLSLDSMGWQDEQRNLYVRGFALRGPIYFFRITDHFPALTARRLWAAGLSPERLSRVSYGLRITGLDPDPPPTELAGMVAS